MRILQIFALFLLVGCATVAADRPASATTPLSSEVSLDENVLMDMVVEQALMIEALQGELIALLDENVLMDMVFEQALMIEALQGELLAYQENDADYGYVYEVEAGQSLWMIADNILGNPYKWVTIYTMNPWVVDPNLIYPYQVLILP